MTPQVLGSRASTFPGGRWVGPAGGAVWLFSVLQYFVVQFVVAGAWPIPYSVRDNVISDLGNTVCGPFSVPHGPSYPVCSPLHAAMNASFIATGVLTLLGLILLWDWWPRGRAATIAWSLWVLAAIGKAVVGLVPENTDIGLHVLGALNIPLGGIAILLFSAAVRRSARGLAHAGVVLGVVGLVGSVLSIAGQYGGSALYLGLGAGGAERVAGYPGNLWMVMVGVAALLGEPAWRRHARHEQRPVGRDGAVSPSA